MIHLKGHTLKLINRTLLNGHYSESRIGENVLFPFKPQLKSTQVAILVKLPFTVTIILTYYGVTMYFLFESTFIRTSG